MSKTVDAPAAKEEARGFADVNPRFAPNPGESPPSDEQKRNPRISWEGENMPPDPELGHYSISCALSAIRPIIN